MTCRALRARHSARGQGLEHKSWGCGEEEGAGEVVLVRASEDLRVKYSLARDSEGERVEEGGGAGAWDVD